MFHGCENNYFVGVIELVIDRRSIFSYIRKDIFACFTIASTQLLPEDVVKKYHSISGTKYSRMDEVKFVEDSL